MDIEQRKMDWIRNKTLLIYFSFILILSWSCNSLGPTSKPSENPLKEPRVTLSNNQLTATFNSLQGFQITFPEDWTILEEPQLLFGAKMNCDSSVDFCNNFTIMIHDIDPSLSYEEHGQSYIDGFSKITEGSELIDFSKGVTNNGNIITLFIDQTYKWNNLELGGMVKFFFLKKKKKVIVITMQAGRAIQDQYLKSKSIFSKILDSIEFSQKD